MDHGMIDGLRAAGSGLFMARQELAVQTEIARRAARAAAAAGVSERVISRELGVARSRTVRRWLGKDDVTATPMRRHRPDVTATPMRRHRPEIAEAVLRVHEWDVFEAVPTEQELFEAIPTEQELFEAIPTERDVFEAITGQRVPGVRWANDDQ